MSNRLADATSPYLLQHKDNPVQWHPWGEEAFALARATDRPLLISVGYASCHWCHVMAHESFEDPQIAAAMNEHFVSVKVDREERPDVDAVYMQAVQAMTGSGGWPMTVVATPEGVPFFGGTYFPPEDRMGRPGFVRVLQALADAWRERRQEVLESAASMREALARMAAAPVVSPTTPNVPGEALAGAVLDALERDFDASHGGFGGAPKFPPHALLRYLLCRPEERAWEMAQRTLRGMAEGGIQDHLGGGFARYSVDAAWHVPHFEKMLGDNGQLLRSYSAAYQRSGDAQFRRVARDIVAWLARDMVLENGGLASALDADSGGQEGRYYLWTEGELRAAAGEDAELAARAFGVRTPGEVDGSSTLRRAIPLAQLAEALGLSPDEAGARLERARRALHAARSERVRPALDDKVLTSWNGLALAGLADAARLLGDEQALNLARCNVAFVRRHLWRDGRLMHRYRRGVAGIEGLLEDYAFYGLGLVALHRIVDDPELLSWARTLGAAVLDRFEDADGGGYFSTAVDAEALLVRPRNWVDGATPAENAAAAELLAELARHTGEPRWREAAERALRPVAGAMARAPSGFAGSLLARTLLDELPTELVLVGAPGDPVAGALEAVWRRFADGRTAVLRLHEGGAPGLRGVALALGRTPVGGRATAYLCRGGSCRRPVTEPADLERELRGAGLRPLRD